MNHNSPNEVIIIKVCPCISYFVSPVDTRSGKQGNLYEEKLKENKMKKKKSKSF